MKRTLSTVEAKENAQRATLSHMARPSHQAGSGQGRDVEEGTEELGPVQAAASLLSALANKSQETTSVDISLMEMELEKSFMTTTKENQEDISANMSVDGKGSVAETLLPPKLVKLEENTIALSPDQEGPVKGPRNKGRKKSDQDATFVKVIGLASVGLTEAQ